MQLARGDVSVQRAVLPDHPETATDQTVAEMVRLAGSQWGSRSPKIRALAINIVRQDGVREKDYYGEILAIHQWIQRNIRYVRDPINQETLSTPEELALNTRAGDCDDMVVLEMALLGAIGVDSWPVVIGMRPGTYDHVYLRAQVPMGRGRKAGEVVNLDPIMKEWPAGREAPASRIREIKDYREVRRMSNHLNGLDADLGDIWAGMRGRSLGSYVTGPSYLDTEDSEAGMLLRDTAADGTVATTPRANTPVEGLDGMFLGNVEMLKEQKKFSNAMEVNEPAMMFRRDDLYQLGPKGPLTARAARMDTQPLASQGVVPIGSKTYEMPTTTEALRRANGHGGPKPVATRQTIITVRPKGSTAGMPKTRDEEHAEIRGIAEYLEQRRGFLPGLGQEGSKEALLQTAEEVATAGWWARQKAKMSAAKEAWLIEKKRQADLLKNYEASKAAAAEAKEQAKVTEEAVQTAVKAGEISQQMARQDPEVAVATVETSMALEQAQKETGQPGQVDQQTAIEGLGTMDLGHRRHAAWMRRDQQVRSKIKTLRNIAAPRREAIHQWLSHRKQSPVVAPIPVLGVRKPAHIGKVPILSQADLKRIQAFQQVVTGRSNMAGFGEEPKSSVLPIPLLLGGAAIAAFLLLRKGK